MQTSTHSFRPKDMEDAAFRAWVAQTRAIHQQLFGRPLGAHHLDRDRAVFMAAEHHAVAGVPVGRAGLTVYDETLPDAETGAPGAAWVAVGGGGVVAPHTERFHVSAFVPRALLRFLLARPGRLRRPLWLLATNSNPVSSVLFARSCRVVHPRPGREQPELERVRRAVLARFHREKLAHYDRTRRLPGAPPAFARTLELRRGDPLLESYLPLHGDWRGGERLPMLVRLCASDLIRSVALRSARPVHKALAAVVPGRRVEARARASSTPR